MYCNSRSKSPDPISTASSSTSVVAAEDEAETAAIAFNILLGTEETPPPGIQKVGELVAVSLPLEI
jgi:hypothetical protein